MRDRFDAWLIDSIIEIANQQEINRTQRQGNPDIIPGKKWVARMRYEVKLQRILG